MPLKPVFDKAPLTMLTSQPLRAGQVRVLLGSTAKMGAGTNCQDRLIALHHLDCPWKPSDLERAPVKAS